MCMEKPAGKAFGALAPIDSIRIYDYEQLPKPEISGGLDVDSVKEYKIPEDRMPYVHDQGDISSCVAHAITATLESLHYIETGEWVKLSPGWFYGYARDEWSTGEGMITSKAVEKTTDYGSVPIEVFNEHTEMPDMKKIAKARPELEKYAKPYKTSAFARINHADKDKKWRAIKEAFLTYQCPIVIDSRNYFGEGHAIMAYGFTENDKNGEKRLYFQNSWGESYGNKGRSSIPFDSCSGVYVLFDDVVKLPFTDVPESAWYYKNVLHMYASGMINGYEDNTFKPNEPITRAEVCAMIDRLAKKIDDKDTQMMESVYEYIDRRHENKVR